MNESACFRRMALTLILMVSAVMIPAAGDAREKPWKFVVMSDTRSDPCAANGKSGVNSAVLGRIARAVADERPDLVIVPGDLVLGYAYKCGPAEPLENQLLNWRKAMKPVYDAGIRVLPVRGNHESASKEYFPRDPCRQQTPHPEALQAWLAVFGKELPQNGPEGRKGLTFAHPHKNALFIGLDQLSDHLSHDQAWLETTLKKRGRQHLFVFGHYPAFQVMHKDNLSCNTAARDQLWRTIGANNGRFYFCGHDHFYDRAGIADPIGNIISQVVTGNGGAPSHDYTGGYADRRVKAGKRILDSHGYLLVTVKGAAVSAELKTLDKDGKSVSDSM